MRIKQTVFLWLFFVATSCVPCFAQYYPLDYFQSPMDTPLYLSAPFGSLRENHFHSGMDIRTYEKEGLPVYAVADGFVSRIKVSAVGYGKAAYIDHPNGYTSVYGHLQRYEDPLAAYIKKYQYETESFEFDHFPGRNRIPVKKGQLIGYSGNSGGSTGPHLHFEIRDTKSEEPLNPQLFGIPGADVYDPFIKRLVLYQLDQNRPQVIYNRLLNAGNTFYTDSGWVLKDTLPVFKGKLGTGIEAYDYLTNRTSEYSIYCFETYADRQKLFSFRIDRINFDDTRYINAHIDYELYRKEGYRVQKCFLDDGNRIQVYPYQRNKGKINIKDTLVHTLQFCVGDFGGRTINLFVFVKAGEQLPQTVANCSSNLFYPSKDNTYGDKLISIQAPSRSLYDTLPVCYALLNGKPKGSLSPVHQVHYPFTPIHKSIGISIKSDSIPPAYADKMLLATVQKDGSLRSAGGELKDGWVTTRTTSFGNYTVTIDSIAPEIRPLNVQKDGVVKDTSSLRFRISDDFSGVSAYKGTINGKWILMDYDAKNDLLTYAFDDQTIFNKKLLMVLIVTDKKGNSTKWEKELEFKK